jgi:hypothetical protein
LASIDPDGYPTGKSPIRCEAAGFPVESYFSDFPKFCLWRLTQITLIFPPSCPTEGRIRIVRDAGRDAVDATASGVKRDGRADSLGICERSNGALANGVAAYGEVVWS